MTLLAAAVVLASQVLPFTGTNLSGGDFAHPQVGKHMVYGKDFVYPDAKEFDYFAGKGVNVVRIGFLWEILQPELNQAFDAAEIGRLSDVVKQATDRHLTVLLDPHNYARYYGKEIGSSDVPDSAFANFWGRLATAFRGNGRVWFGIMNEPHDIPAERWVQSANAAIRQIRASGAKNRILVPGVAWTGAWSWDSTSYGVPNAVAMDRIVDPGRNYAIEAHQYLDQDGSGTHLGVVSPKVGSERLATFVRWCRSRRLKAFLGEFAVGGTAEGKLALEDMLGAMERDRDVWLGFTWWSAGPWWGDYMFTIEPKASQDRPQMTWLAPHLQRATL